MDNSKPELCPAPPALSELIRNEISVLAPSDQPHSLGRLGKYEVSEVIGVGGMGIVFKARDEELGRWVAIKTLAPHRAGNPTARRRFAKEARAAASLRHPNVIPIYGVSVDEPFPYLVMPYMAGGSLQQALDQQKTFSLHEIVKIGAETAAALAAAHQKGIVHRDIKPENILLDTEHHEVIVTDFGLARGIQDDSITESGNPIGTPQFMSPEQALGQPLDPRSDLFSLGSLLYTLCTNRVPFSADSLVGISRQITDEAPIPIQKLNPEIPSWFCKIVSKLMAKEKSQRYSSASEVQFVLEAAVAQTLTSKSPLPGGKSESSPIGRQPDLILPVALTTLIALIMVSALIVAAFVLPARTTLEQAPRSDRTARNSPKTPPTSVDERFIPKPTPPTVAASALTWEQVFASSNRQAPTNYPTWPLSLIEILNQCRGQWSLSGDFQSPHGDVQFQGKMRCANEFQRAPNVPDVLQLSLEFQWTQQLATHSLTLTPLVMLEQHDVSLLMTVNYTVDGVSLMPIGADVFDATWDPEKHTLELVPSRRTFSVFAEGTLALPDLNSSLPGFRMVFQPGGKLEIIGLPLVEQQQLTLRTETRINESAE